MNSNRNIIWIVAAGILVSTLWFVISVWYVSDNFGWGNLTQSLPHEMAVVILGIFLPIAALWLFLLIFLRRDSSHPDT